MSDLESDTLAYFNRLVEHRSEGSNPGSLAGALDSLIWFSPSVGRVIDEWVTSPTKFKVEVVLNVDEVFPRLPRRELEAELGRIESSWPDLAPLCRRMREAMDKSRIK